MSAKPLPNLSLPGVWRADASASAALHRVEGICSTGYGALDAELPGGGWPACGLVELLVPSGALHRWQLLIPGIVQRLARHAGTLVLVGTPPGPAMQPYSASLAAQGLAPNRLLHVLAPNLAQRLWACEQALGCPEVAAVVAWLMPAVAEGRYGQDAVSFTQLRRLQVRALAHGTLLFAVRRLNAECQSSPAMLRLRLEADSAAEVGLQGVQVIKRPGVPSLKPLRLPGVASRLMAYLAACRTLEEDHALAGAASA